MFFKNKILLILIFIFFFCTVKSPENKTQANEKHMNIRKAAVAGSFYPASKDELENMIKTYFSNAKTEPLTFIPKILISPHAGYIYSGPVAAYGYKTIQGIPFKTIILLGPAHYEYLQGASIYTDGMFETPLGKIEIDNELANKILKENPVFTNNTSSHIKEHSLETQLPFLQLILKNFKIVPIVIGELKNIENYKIIADAIAKNIEDRNDVLIIASTDLSHYYSYEIAQKMDAIAIDGITRLDPDFMLRRISSGECELCGFNGVLVSLLVAKYFNLNKTILLNKANSGDTEGDKKRVVGYTSILIGKSQGDNKLDELTEQEKNELIKIAKDTIFSFIKYGKIPKIENITNPKLLAKQGAFVTIKINHNLRGCIGIFTSEDPLYKTIIEMAISAASRDPRFSPLSKDELKNISLEISVLSELKPIKNVDEIKVGVHGIYIMQGYYRGVLLPQVATEYGWNRETFLEQTCNKAGLDRNEWKNPNTKIYIFSAQVFGEK